MSGVVAIKTSSSSPFELNSKSLIGVGVGVAAVCGASYLLYRHLKRDVMPVKWRRVGTLQPIYLFPVKSCGPLERTPQLAYDCDTLGLSLNGLRDRNLMLINERNEMITARGYPHMVKIQPKLLVDGTLVFNFPDLPEIELNLKNLEPSGNDVHTAVWGVPVDAMPCGERFDKWFSKAILKKDTGVRLVHYPYPKPVRQTVERLRHMPFLRKEDSGTFQDATSYMIMNLASVADLNTRLKRPVESQQFRSTFELKMDVDEAYAEDNWQWVRIGDDAVFRIVAPCTRCILPNINVHTAERDVDGEPLKTLRSYRLFNYSSPALGVHLGLRVPGKVKANDIIYVEEK
ncbi:mitochondrial amidoxime-reducing component 1 [Drosophila willistoni]|uniref:mitochondrial amidoxime-reducing component 1 n=1 Tax=Drosophila willistoni TaxID=7260 RepID=UPI00017D6390|nr:mitochondrial amidoxime-reducing component 1 [Drosophila willistoni]